MAAGRLILFLSLVLLFGDAAVAAPGDPRCRFDLDGDGFVTQGDLNYCFTLLQVFPPAYDERCDADGDGAMSISDIGQIVSAVQSGLDCRATVPSSTTTSRWMLLSALLLTSGFALRLASTRRIAQ